MCFLSDFFCNFFVIGSVPWGGFDMTLIYQILSEDGIHFVLTMCTIFFCQSVYNIRRFKCDWTCMMRLYSACTVAMRIIICMV